LNKKAIVKKRDKFDGEFEDEGEDEGEDEEEGGSNDEEADKTANNKFNSRKNWIQDPEQIRQQWAAKRNAKKYGNNNNNAVKNEPPPLDNQQNFTTKQPTKFYKNIKQKQKPIIVNQTNEPTVDSLPNIEAKPQRSQQQGITNETTDPTADQIKRDRRFKEQNKKNHNRRDLASKKMNRGLL
jgi:hypothetical protein